jgi:hypothetical protein
LNRVRFTEQKSSFSFFPISLPGSHCSSTSLKPNLAAPSKRMGSARGAPKFTPTEEELLHRRALAMAIHQHLDTSGSWSG